MGTKVGRFSFLWVSRVTGASVLLDYVVVANVVTNYSAARVPLETMWTDIGKLSLLYGVDMSIHGPRIRLYVQAQDIHDGSRLFPTCPHA